MKHFLSTIVIFLLIVSGCNTQNSAQENSIISEQISIETQFCPHQNCTQFFIDKISRAEEELNCAFFDLEDQSLIKALETKRKTINTKIILDELNYENQLIGQKLKVVNPVQYMHNKFCIIDNNAIITGSTNPTNNGFNFNNNNLIYIESETLAKNYNKEFNELYNGIFGAGAVTKTPTITAGTTTIQNYFCPDDNCQEKVIKTLKQAEHTIYFMTFSFTDEQIADTLLVSEADVKGIIEKRNINSKGSQYHRMKDFGLNVIFDTNGKSMHHKVFIIDNQTVITGSYNPTKSGNTRNDENILIITNKDIAERYVEEFESLFVS